MIWRFNSRVWFWTLRNVFWVLPEITKHSVHVIANFLVGEKYVCHASSWLPSLSPVLPASLGLCAGFQQPIISMRQTGEPCNPPRWGYR